MAILQPVKLTCEYLEHPLGIDIAKPRFSWSYAAQQDQMQSAYELIVIDNKDTIWSTGKVSSSQNLHIVYNGPALRSCTRYRWRLRVYNQNNEAAAWREAWFETAIMQAWKAQWIGDGSQQPASEEDFYKDDRMPIFQKNFNAIKSIKTARLYISGLGYYEASLNGKKIGDHVLDAGFTTYAKQVLYVTHDITSFIKKGKNNARILLGNGWWNPLPFKFFGRWKLSDYQQTGRPCVKAQILLQYNDGTKKPSSPTIPGKPRKALSYETIFTSAKHTTRGWKTIKPGRTPPL